MKILVQTTGILLGTLLLAGSVAQAQSTTILKRPPESSVREKTPLNLARSYLGAQIELANGNSSAGIEPGVGSNDPNGGLAALISDDETIGFPVAAGSTRVIVTLPRPVLLSSIEVSSFTIQGRLNAWVSPIKMAASDSRWRQVVRDKNFVQSKPLFVKFGSADAAYVMIEFAATEKGRVGALGIYGDVKIADVKVTADPKPISDLPPMGEVVDYNYANLVSGGQIAYTSSSKGNAQADRMIDDVPDTSYAFNPADPSPISIVQLESERPVRRVAVSYEAEKPGKMEFYLLNKIPGEVKKEQASNEGGSQWIRASNPAIPRVIAAQGSGPQTIEIDSSYFENHKPTGSVDTEAGNRRVAFECKAVESNFLMVRWLPSDGKAGNFKVSEINVFGNTEKEDVHVAWGEPESPGEGGNQAPIGTPSLPVFGGGSMEPPDLPNISEP